MSQNVSAGVYSKIIDLGAFVSAVPGTIGVICALTKKGEDNNLKLVSSRSALISEFGEPNINDYGKAYGQGLYNAYEFLGEAGSLYFMRALPDDASYSNIMIEINDPSTSNATVSVSSTASVNTLNELKTLVGTSSAPVYPLCALYPIGRGEYYNALGIKLTAVSNATVSGVYVLDIYEKQSDGNDVIIESFEVSFDPTAVDTSGESIFIEYVLYTYSSVLRALMQDSNGDWSDGYARSFQIYDKSIGLVSVDTTATTAELTDDKQNFSDWETTSGDRSYMVMVQDNRGRTLYGWLGASSGTYNTSVEIFQTPDETDTARGWNGTTTSFNTAGTITYMIKKNQIDIASAFTTQVPLRNGSDGSLIVAGGAIDSSSAEQTLVKAYAGTLIDPRAVEVGTLADLITDTENLYFNVVFDCGYPLSVKNEIVGLAQDTRKDCIAIIDNGDHSTLARSQSTRANSTTYNTYFAALYEQYSKVYDQFTGQDIWFAPSYHMSTLIPRNDRVGSLWTAAAGFNRASISGIKELRYYPKQADRDALYLDQLNSIVKFNEGYAPWSQLTTQAKASPMQDINIVRLVLYVERALKEFARAFIFEQNDEITWSQVSTEVTDFLENVKRQRGLYGYSVDVGATTYEKKRKTFHIDVILNPTRVVEIIELRFFVE